MLVRLAFVTLTILSMVSGAMASTSTSAAPVVELRSGLNALLCEHVILATAATGSALEGRDSEFRAAAAALDSNSMDLAKVIGSVYGPDAEKTFLQLWRKYIGLFVDYATGLKTNDRAKQDKAFDSLVEYGGQLGAFLNAANADLRVTTVAELVTTHVLALKDIIDAQAAKNPIKVYNALRASASHMQMIANPLARAVVRQFPDKFADSPNSSSARLRAALSSVLREHVFLAAFATGSVLGSRDEEFKAAAAALDDNSVDLAKAIGSAYGADAGRAFLQSWRKHIGSIVDYAVGLKTRDTARQNKAVDDLVRHSQQLGTLLNSANVSLPVATLARHVTYHAVSLLDVINAQAAKNPIQAYAALRTSAGLMQMIAGPWAEAIVKRFPDKFTD